MLLDQLILEDLIGIWQSGVGKTRERPSLLTLLWAVFKVNTMSSTDSILVAFVLQLFLRCYISSTDAWVSYPFGQAYGGFPLGQIHGKARIQYSCLLCDTGTPRWIRLLHPLTAGRLTVDISWIVLEIRSSLFSRQLSRVRSLWRLFRLWSGAPEFVCSLFSDLIYAGFLCLQRFIHYEGFSAI